MIAFVLISLTALLATGLVSALPHLELRNSLPSGCRYMSNSDFITLSDGEMQLILEYFNSQLDGQTVCATGAQDSSVPWGCNLEKVKAGGFFGGLDSSGNDDGSANTASGDSLDWNPDYVNAILHIPTLDQQADYGVQVPVVCLSSANANVFFDSDASACQYQNSVASGSTVDDGTSVSLQIQQSDSVSYTYTTDSSISIAAGLSYTYTAGVPDTESMSITASLTVTVGYDESDSTATVQQQTDTLTVTVAPAAGQKCWITLTSESCPGTAVINTPVTFPESNSYGSAVSFNAFVEFPKNRPDNAKYNGQNEYWAGDLGSILSLNSTGQQFLTTEVTLAYDSTGTYAENCTSDGSSAVTSSITPSSTSTTATSLTTATSSTPETGSTTATGSATSTSTSGPISSSQGSSVYAPSLSCPGSVAVINACSGVVADWTSQLTTDSAAWAANNVTLTQTPAPGSLMTFGPQKITFHAISGTTGASATCSSVAQIVPKWAVEFSPEVDTMLYPSDGSNVKDQKYVIGYIGLCSAQQYGQCLLNNVTSQDCSDFSYTQTSPSGAPLTVLNFSNGGNAWPSSDSLSFTVSCSDAYGNNGEAIVFQAAQLGGEYTTTIDGYTSTLTQHSTTSYLYTAIDTINTFTLIPQLTEILHTATYYTSTQFDTTQYVTAKNAKVSTKTVKHTQTKTHTSTTTMQITSTLAPTTLTIIQAAQQVATTLTVTLTASPITIQPTITTAVTTTSTSVPAGCTTVTIAKNHWRRDDMTKEIGARGVITGTTTVLNPSQTLVITDGTDVATIVNSGTTTYTDYTDQTTYTAKSTNIDWDMTDTAYVYGVLTTPLVNVIESYIKTTTLLPSTITMTAPGQELVQTSSSTITTTSTITASPTTITMLSTTAITQYACTRTRMSHHW